MNAFNLYEAYAAVYDEDLREDILTVEEDFSFIDDLSDSELDVVMEEIIVEENLDLNECFEMFDDFLIEATVTSSDDRSSSGSSKVTTGQGSVMAARERVAARKQARKSKEKEERSQRRAERVERIKGSISRVAKTIGKKLTVGAEKAKRALQGRDSASERKVRQAKIKMRDVARKGIRKAVTGERGQTRPPAVTVGKKEEAGGEVKQTKTVSTPNKERIATAKAKLAKAAAGTSARGVRFATSGGEVASQRASTGRKEALGKFRKKVGLSDHYEYILDVICEDMINEKYVSDYETALYAVESLSENDLEYVLESYDLYLTEETETVDLYDVVLEHLLDEGYADTEDAATVIMANMSEEWREEILDEAKKKFPEDKVKEKAAKHERNYLTRPNSQVGQRSISNARKMKAIASTVSAGDDPRSTMHGQDLRKLGKKEFK
jgi:hypothetical protein